jgi:hypothetical protein
VHSKTSLEEHNTIGNGNTVPSTRKGSKTNIISVDNPKFLKEIGIKIINNEKEKKEYRMKY